MNPVRRVLLWFLALTILGTNAGTSSWTEGASQPTQYYKVRLKGRAEIKLEIAQKEVQLGKPLMVTKTIKNLANKDFLVDEDSFLGNFFIERIAPPRSCGSFGSHTPDFHPSVITLNPGANLTRTVDLSQERCIAGAGLYKVYGSYCHYEKGRIHGRDNASWCVSASPGEVRIVDEMEAD